ncbi:MAG: class I SAM-dependent methyltransferase [Methanospirillaceae archaeon]|nr:class I SAM-dependent methyltransferase [Methanospirillaceae archaeon]
MMSIDWNEVWKTQLTQSTMPKPDAYSNWWESVESARRYLKDYGNGNGTGPDRVAWTIEQLNLTQQSRVLEIGCGPGVLSVPIAQIAKEVTVVEPSAGMLQVLCEYAESKKVTNINCIKKRWEEVTDDDISSQYDVVLASMSLAMPEIRAAIEKMNHYCSGSVMLIWFAEEPGFEKIYRYLLPELTGKEFRPSPRADILFNLAYSMGLYPEVGYKKFSFMQQFSHEQEIYDFFQYQHHIVYQKESEAFKNYLNDHLKKTDKGFEHEEDYHCMILRWNV